MKKIRGCYECSKRAVCGLRQRIQKALEESKHLRSASCQGKYYVTGTVFNVVGNFCTEFEQKEGA